MHTRQSLIQNLEALISNNEIASALKLLEEANLPANRRDIIQLKSDFAEFRNARRRGTMRAEDAQVRESQIRERILDLIDEIKLTQQKNIHPGQKTKKEPQRKSLKLWLISAPLGILGIVLVLFFFKKDIIPDSTHSKVILTLKGDGKPPIESTMSDTISVDSLKRKFLGLFHPEYSAEMVVLKANGEAVLGENQTLSEAKIITGATISIHPGRAKVSYVLGQQDTIPREFNNPISLLELEKDYREYFGAKIKATLRFPLEFLKLSINGKSIALPDSVPLYKAGIPNGSFVSLQPDTAKWHEAIQIGKTFHGGIIYEVNPERTEGKLWHEFDGFHLYREGENIAREYRGSEDWKIADINQLLGLYQNKQINYGTSPNKNDYWSSTGLGHGYNESLLSILQKQGVSTGFGPAGNETAVRRKRILVVRTFSIFE